MILLSFKNGNDDPTTNSFDEYQMLLVKIKDFHALIDNKPVLHQSVKNKQEAHEKLIEMSIINDHTTENLLDFSYHQNFYKLTDIEF